GIGAHALGRFLRRHGRGSSARRHRHTGHYVGGHRHPSCVVRTVDAMTPTTVPTTVDRYLEFWSLGPGDEQRRLGDVVFSPSVRYRAPLGERVGVASLLALAAELDEQF